MQQNIKTKIAYSLFLLLTLSCAFAGQTITIDGKAIAGQSIYGNGQQPDGAEPYDGDTDNNTVNIINGSSVEYDVFGAYAETEEESSVLNNKVTITGSEADAVLGGAAVSYEADATAEDNFVTIDASRATMILGGRADAASSSATAQRNHIMVSGESEVGDLIGAEIFAGNVGIASFNTVTLKEESWANSIIGGNAVISDECIENCSLSADNNTVTVTEDSTVNSTVNGGLADLQAKGAASAQYNTINILDGGRADEIYGGHITSYMEGDARTANASYNSVIVEVGDTGDIWGGLVDGLFASAKASSNSVSVYAGEVGSIYGGKVSSEYISAAVEADDNIVNVSASSIHGGTIAGGMAYTDGPNAWTRRNTVTIRNSFVEDDDEEVGGGFARSEGMAEASYNSITITGSYSKHDEGIYGGAAGGVTEAEALYNTVSISGGTSFGDVVGGDAYVDGDGSASSNNNTVNIIDATVINGNIIGGSAYVYGAGTYAANNNIVNIGGSRFEGAVTLYGGMGGEEEDGAAGDLWTGNTLNVLSAGMRVSGVRNFENYNFHLDANTADGDIIFTVTDGDGEGGAADLTNGKIGVIFEGGAPKLAAGDSVTLLDTNGAGLISDGIVATAETGTLAKRYFFDIVADEYNLYAKFIGAKADERVKALSEGQLGGAAFLNLGADLIERFGVVNAFNAEEEGGAGVFAAASGGSSEYKTGSHVDVKGFSVAAGLANSSGDGFVTGLFVEAGRGNYNSFNSFNSAPSVNADGDVEYAGAGFLARYHTDAAYAEGSFRLGQTKTDFSSGDFEGQAKVGYKTSALYTGAHFGAGLLFQSEQRYGLDLSAKILWTRQGGDSVTIENEEVNFGAVNSLRARLGGRASYTAGKVFAPYAGAYFEYEFDGKAEAGVSGENVAAPELKGVVANGEIGVGVKPSARLPLSLNFALQGYAGVRVGFSGSFYVSYML